MNLPNWIVWIGHRRTLFAENKRNNNLKDVLCNSLMIRERERKDHRFLESWRGNHWYRREEEKFILVLEQRPRGQWEYTSRWLYACVHSHAIRDSMRNFNFSSFFHSVIVLSIFDFFLPPLFLSLVPMDGDGFSVTFQQRFCHYVFSCYLPIFLFLSRHV